MTISKKEISILIEIIFSVLFTIIFLPYFYENLFTSFDFSDVAESADLQANSTLATKIIQIIIFAVIYFSITFSVLEFFYKSKTVLDERDDLINSKSYKLGYLLYEFCLFLFIGALFAALFANSSFQNNGTIIFLIILLLIMVSIIKSLYQLYLYRTL
ncbi:MAG: hypothetical protein ACKVJS_03240 [Flavobacteriales bacterium]|jgi:hypothetical protein|tara:strand:- start:3900 stop:4373 length:474 start_codon:yes stop_codon:yes gene_type:complete